MHHAIRKINISHFALLDLHMYIADTDQFDTNPDPTFHFGTAIEPSPNARSSEVQ
jgi:hypothetical protein